MPADVTPSPAASPAAGTPFTYQAQTVSGTFPVPTHRYEREVGRVLTPGYEVF